VVRKGYPSDMTDAKRAILEPMLPPSWGWTTEKPIGWAGIGGLPRTTKGKSIPAKPGSMQRCVTPCSEGLPASDALSYLL